jgi:23S rRNA pseudouridine2605 synthase
MTSSPEGAAVRLQKYLSQSGMASRREGERLILEGRVRVNGEVVRTLGTKIVPGKDRVELDGSEVRLKSTRWVKLYKPRGFVTTRSDPEGRETVYGLLPKGMGELRYVGRLDLLTEGLLLLTNDGEMLHRLTHPSFQVDREYEVWVQKEPSKGAMDRLLRGVALEDGLARAERCEAAGRTRDGALLSLVLREGRNREVRRMMEAIGHPVLRLRRVRYGPVTLGRLGEGEWKELTNQEIRGIKDSVR